MSNYGTYKNRSYSEIFSTVEDFLAAYEDSKFPKILPVSGSEYGADMTTIHYMLLSRFGESIIRSTSERHFVDCLFLTVFQYGPTLAKQLEMQTKLRALSDDEVLLGSRAVYNTARHPSTAPITSSVEPLPKIDSQSTTSYVKSKLEGYSTLAALLDAELINDFLARFEPLFDPLAMPDYDLRYCKEE